MLLYRIPKKVLEFDFPVADVSKVYQINLLPNDCNALEEVVIASTRTNTRIEDLPMKVEVLGLDDINEENTIKPGNISSLLGDLSVIHLQQTSAVSAGTAVRMQGLDGKYTQILRDGLPLYEGFSGNFGVLQILPLDLKQVKIIKGTASTLYGGGAIAGIINLISKTPADQPELSFTLNRSTLQENNVNGYYASKFGRWGVTLFAATTQQKAIDVNGDGLSDVPDVRYYLIHPKLFYTLNKRMKASMGYSGLYENRLGGDMVT
ncbi:MAG: hypothetical protein E6Q66_00505 [Pedobacter sp.]|nr:MAG: hypothetical protein E6Q66_00505 [Pedobacter sp.]